MIVDITTEIPRFSKDSHPFLHPFSKSKKPFVINQCKRIRPLLDCRPRDSCANVALVTIRHSYRSARARPRMAAAPMKTSGFECIHRIHGGYGNTLHAVYAHPR